MLDDNQIDALKKWYCQAWIIESVKKAQNEQNWDDLEAHVQRHSLMPLSKHSKLPDYMKTEGDKPLFPTNLNPMTDEELWQDAIEIGWAIIEKKTGVSMEFVQKQIKSEIDQDWDIFIDSVEKRKKSRDEE